MPDLQDNILNLVAVRRGHFLLESGHHGDLWLDLESLCARPRLIQPLASELAYRLKKYAADWVCGPLVEGAFAGLLVACELNARFVYSERFARPDQDGLFPAAYRVPKVLRHELRQKRVVVVNDVINAGSAVRGTFDDLENCAAHCVAIGCLLTLGTAAQEFAMSKKVALESLAALPNVLWSPPECPLCTAGVPLEDVTGFRDVLSPG
jgi:orotate phosphoribosyltransferase